MIVMFQALQIQKRTCTLQLKDDVQFPLLDGVGYRDGRAFLVSRSRVPGNLGTRARGSANFIQERERIGTRNRNVKVRGNAKTMSYRSAGTRRKIRGTRARGTRSPTGTRAHL